VGAQRVAPARSRDVRVTDARSVVRASHELAPADPAGERAVAEDDGLPSLVRAVHGLEAQRREAARTGLLAHARGDRDETGPASVHLEVELLRDAGRIAGSPHGVADLVRRD